MKNSGKNLSFWFDGVEQAVENVEFDSDYTELETTDSSTQSPASDFIMNRTKRTAKIDTILREANGATVSGGTLTKDVKYIVTLGTVGGHVLGEIFTSDGTETPDGSNTVEPLGAVLPGKDIDLTVNSVTVPVTNFKFDDVYGEFDSTDSETTGDATEFITGRTKRTGTLEVIMRTEDADLLTSDPASQPIVLTFGSGYTITGNATFRKKTSVSNAKGDMVKTTYEVTFNGSITSTLANILTMATSKAVEIIWAEGTSTNKEATGNGIIMSASYEADVSGLIRVTYTMNFVGAVTEAVAT